MIEEETGRGHSLKLDTHTLESSSASTSCQGSEEKSIIKTPTHSSKFTGTIEHPAVQTEIWSHLVADIVAASLPTLSHYGANSRFPVGKGGGVGASTTSVWPSCFGGVVPTAHGSKGNILLPCRDAGLVIVEGRYMVERPALLFQVALLGLVHCVPLATLCRASVLSADACT